MRKSFIAVAIAAAALAGCSNKQAAPSKPATPATTPTNPSPTGSTQTPSGQTNNPATANNPAKAAQPTPPASNTQGGANTTTGSAKPIPKPPAGAATPTTITKQQYDQLQFNLSFDQVQKAIGLGKLVKQTEHQAMYDYVIKEGGTAELEFWDGLLNSKSIRDSSDFVPPAQAKTK